MSGAPGPLGPGSERIDLTASDGVALRAARRPAEGAARGRALLLHGRTEFLEKFADPAAALARRGFEVWSIDWRGQGASARSLADPLKGHVGDFAEYQRDLAALAAAGQDPTLVIANSMGGAVALRALASGALRARAAVFLAPMWGLAMAPLKARAARLMARAATGLGLGGLYAPGGGGPRPYALRGFPDNVLTPDEAAFERIAALVREAGPQALGGPTLGWLDAAFREMDALVPLRLQVPALVLAGSEEMVTDVAAMRARAARDSLRFAEIGGARHELLIDAPERRGRVWGLIDAFLAETGASPASPASETA